MNDRRNAGEKTIQQLAEFFGDPRFYDVVGMDRPEKFLTYTRRNWGTVPDEVKKKIAEEVSRYATEPVPKEDE
jgi:hypothetical protein